MIKDEERREVAQKLRNAKIDSCPGSVNGIPLGCIGVLFAKIVSPSEAETKFAADRLADLIEPSEQKAKCVVEAKVDGERLEELVHDAAMELTGIDRVELFELADECGDASRAYAVDGHELTSRQFANVARRIREALGVEQ